MFPMALLLALSSLTGAGSAQVPDIMAGTDASAWEPQFGSPPARVEIQPDGTSCVVLEGTFTKAGDRLCWDWVGPLDLSASEAVTMEFRAENGGIGRNLGIYFGSGDGWYPRFWWGGVPDSWSRVTYDLDDFGTEGTPEGWDKVSRFRFSLWSGGAGHVVFRLRGFRAVPRDPHRNYIRNGSFEVPGPLPYAWGTGHWGVGGLPWAADMDLWRAHFGIDNTVAHDGNSSLRVVNGPGLPELRAVSAWFGLPTATGAKYTLSAWLKADREGVPVGLTGGETTAEVQVGTQWQRVVLPGIAAGTNLSLAIAPRGEATLWLDGVAVQREGGDTEQYHPHPDEANLIAREALVDWSPPTRAAAVAAGRTTTGPLGPTQVQIDDHARFLVNGEPYLQHSLGLEFISDLGMLDVAATAGFADVCIEINPNVTTERLKSYFDRCADLGMRVIPWMDGTIPIERLREHITTLRNHPALLCWYVYDEPSGERFAEANARLSMAHDLDPSHPALINYLGDKLTEQMGDIYSTDIYPIPSSSPSAAIGGVRVMQSGAVAEGKPVWMWLQATGYAYSMDREPTPRELSCMVYGSLIEGARGIYYFAQIPRSRECWAEMRALCVELAALRPVLGSLDPAPALTCDTDGLLTDSFSYQGETWVLAVNTHSETIDAALTLPGQTGQVEVVFEARTLAAADGAWTDTFGPYERHVYRLAR